MGEANIGYEAGSQCNRNGCSGIIEEHEGDGGCSCHISPPCSYCTTAREYCPVCEWDAELEQIKEAEDKSQKEQEYWAEVRKQERMRPRIFDPSKLNITRAEGHTNSSMIKEGIAPNSMSISDVSKEVIGTFGGKFLSWNEGETHTRFRYMAYTD